MAERDRRKCDDCGSEMDCVHDYSTDLSGGETWECPDCGAEEIITFDA